MNKEREIDGIKIIVNGEQYEAYKGTLQEEIKKQNKYIEMLQNNIEKLVEENGEKAGRINKTIEYIEKINPQEMYPDHYIMIKYISDILKGDNK